MPHLTKITLLPDKITKYVVTTKCSTCDAMVSVPEPYLTWYARTFDADPATIMIRCIDCGGPVLSEFEFSPAHWSQCTLEHEEKPLCKVPDTVVDDTEDWRETFYGDTGEHTHVSYKYEEWCNKGTHYVTFSEAHKELRTFMLTENANEQSGIVESSMHDRPESNQEG